MARVKNTPRVQRKAIKENQQRAIAKVKTVGKVTARAVPKIGGKTVGETRPGLARLSYKTLVAKESARAAGVPEKKINKTLKKSSKGITNPLYPEKK